jgi:seryl-tRNA synthetase
MDTETVPQPRPPAALPAGPAPVPTAAAGVFLGPPAYERLVTTLRSAVDGMADAGTEAPLAVPPVIAREVVERAGYVRSFPQLLGTVHSFGGSRREWLRLSRLVQGGDWHQRQEVTDLVLLPAACYHAYPLLAGTVLPGPRQLCLHGTCFRQEASAEIGRLRSFRMSELVRIGSAAECERWRDDWVGRLADWLRGLGLSVDVEVADDPFFGTGDTLLRDSQREQRLKWELRVPLGGGVIQAVASANCHLDHFGTAFDIGIGDGPAHSACVAFGLDRIALALVAAHGADLSGWPASAREALADG